MNINFCVYTEDGEIETLATVGSGRVPAKGETVHLNGRKIGSDPNLEDGWNFEVTDVAWSASAGVEDSLTSVTVMLQVRPVEQEFKYSTLCDCDAPSPDQEDLRYCDDCAHKLRDQVALDVMPKFWVWDVSNREVIPVTMHGLVLHVMRHFHEPFQTGAEIANAFGERLLANRSKRVMGFAKDIVIEPVKYLRGKGTEYEEGVWTLDKMSDEDIVERFGRHVFDWTETKSV